MIVTEKDMEIRNWVNKNKDKHKWVTHTMLDLYAKHYHQEQVKKLNIEDVSERILLVRWMDGNPILDGAEYFANMDEALERYNEMLKFKNVEYTICKIKNAR